MTYTVLRDNGTGHPYKELLETEEAGNHQHALHVWLMREPGYYQIVPKLPKSGFVNYVVGDEQFRYMYFEVTKMDKDEDPKLEKLPERGYRIDLSKGDPTGYKVPFIQAFHSLSEITEKLFEVEQHMRRIYENGKTADMVLFVKNYRDSGEESLQVDIRGCTNALIQFDHNLVHAGEQTHS